MVLGWPESLLRFGQFTTNEHWRVDAFELWCWRRLLRVPWAARRSNQSILKGISPEYSLEGLMLKLKLQYFGHLMQRTDSLETTLMLGKIEGRRRKRWQRMNEMVGWHHWLDGHEFERSPGIGDRQGSLACYSPWGHKQLDMTEQLNWTDVMNMAEHKLSLWIRVLLLAGRREMNWRRQQFLPQPLPPISSFSPTVPWLTSVLCLVCISILYECELIFILHKKRLST